MTRNHFKNHHKVIQASLLVELSKDCLIIIFYDTLAPYKNVVFSSLCRTFAQRNISDLI